MSYDKIMQKPVNDFSGPISTPGLIICGILVVTGAFLMLKKSGKPGMNTNTVKHK